MNTGGNLGLDLTNFHQLSPQVAQRAFQDGRTSTLDRRVAPHRQTIHVTRQKPPHVRLRNTNRHQIVAFGFFRKATIFLLPRRNTLVRVEPLLPNFSSLLNRHEDANASRIVPQTLRTTAIQQAEVCRLGDLATATNGLSSNGVQVFTVLERLDHAFILRDRSSQSKFHLTKISIHKKPTIRSLNTPTEVFVSGDLLVVGFDAGHAATFGSELQIAGTNKTIGVKFFKDGVHHLAALFGFLPSQVGLDNVVVSRISLERNAASTRFSRFVVHRLLAKECRELLQKLLW